ncbi:response regulator transcription factor [Cohnella fermenti]|uniref:Response regulator n=1 Tax=Cohnella fermenti TaxID=2565925 RepID=A0A4V3WF07_9BACL|nr:response regulator [Cohnella fermenti]THF78408.1 response regulator [Cohnella fermenti]
MPKVLIADDEHMIKLSLTKLIDDSNSGFKVVGLADDGQEALESIESLNPDLLITDINMPVMDGFELIAELGRTRRDLDIVVISGYDEFEYVQSALRHGVSDYLLKPVKSDQVLRMLNKLSEKRSAERESRQLRSSSIKDSKSLAERLADSLWSAHEPEVAQAIADVREHSASLESSQYPPSPFFLDLLVFLNDELIRLSGGSISSKQAFEEEWRGAAAPMTDQLERLAKELIEAVRSTRNWGYKKQIAKSIDFLNERCGDEGLTLQTVAEHVGMSSGYFSRIFKDMMGESFIQYLINLRLERAKALLAESDCLTYEAAYKVGYSDYPHFAKAFKRKFSLSPSEYRKNMSQ